MTVSACVHCRQHRCIRFEAGEEMMLSPTHKMRIRSGLLFILTITGAITTRFKLMSSPITQQRPSRIKQK